MRGGRLHVRRNKVGVDEDQVKMCEWYDVTVHRTSEAQDRTFRKLKSWAELFRWTEQGLEYEAGERRFCEAGG